MGRFSSYAYVVVPRMWMLDNGIVLCIVPSSPRYQSCVFLTTVSSTAQVLYIDY